MRTEGERLRDEGCQRTLFRLDHEAWREAYRQTAWRVFGKMRTGQVFTADDIRKAMTDQPEHHNAWGAAFRAWLNEARKAGAIISDWGTANSKRTSRHASLTRAYLKHFGVKHT